MNIGKRMSLWVQHPLDLAGLVIKGEEELPKVEKIKEEITSSIA